MLPIFRIISVGGVTLAISILALALIPPGGTRLVLAQHEVVARGPLMDLGTHPEWRQFLIHAALRRAGELDRLRDLRDTIVRAPDVTAPEPEIEIVIQPPATPNPQLAGLTFGAESSEPEDVTGSIDGDRSATIPIEIGEASSTELPVTAVENTPPVVRLPALQTPSQEPAPAPAVTAPAASEPVRKPETRQRAVQQRPRRKPPAPPEPQPLPPPFNILAAIFNSFANAESTRQASSPSNKATPSPGIREASPARTASR